MHKLIWLLYRDNQRLKGGGRISCDSTELVDICRVGQSASDSNKEQTRESGNVCAGHRGGSIIKVPVDIELFATDITIYIERNNLERFIACQEISAACIYLYIKRVINVYLFLGIKY